MEISGFRCMKFGYIVFKGIKEIFYLRVKTPGFLKLSNKTTIYVKNNYFNKIPPLLTSPPSIAAVMQHQYSSLLSGPVQPVQGLW